MSASFFAFGQSSASAAADTIDLTFITNGANETVTLPLSNNTFTNVVVNWGDTNSSTITSNTDTTHMTHTFATAGTYAVTVGAPATGSIVQFGNGNAVWSAGASFLSAVTAWGSTVTNLSGAFYGATNLVSVPTALPAGVTNLSLRLSRCK